MASKQKNEKIDELVKTLQDEFIRNDGYITCEITSCPDDMALFTRTIWKHKKLNGFNDIGYWSISLCETCHGHHGGEYYLHCEIRKHS